MNDWWNDPPEEPELPGCPECDGDTDYLRDEKSGQVLKCRECAHQWSLPFLVEPDPPEEVVRDDDDVPEYAEGKCPHWNGWGDCDECDHASDIAYDAARESRR
tara:strand:+ start:81 stop:389 length:309 start_codon:yes stop_codon:yes gene_type:complete